MLMASPAQNQVVGRPWPQGVVQGGHHVARRSCRAWGQHGDGGANSRGLSVPWGFICKDVKMVGNDSYYLASEPF